MARPWVNAVEGQQVATQYGGMPAHSDIGDHAGERRADPAGQAGGNGEGIRVLIALSSIDSAPHGVESTLEGVEHPKQRVERRDRSIGLGKEPDGGKLEPETQKGDAVRYPTIARASPLILSHRRQGDDLGAVPRGSVGDHPPAASQPLEEKADLGRRASSAPQHLLERARLPAQRLEDVVLAQRATRHSLARRLAGGDLDSTAQVLRCRDREWSGTAPWDATLCRSAPSRTPRSHREHVRSGQVERDQHVGGVAHRKAAIGQEVVRAARRRATNRSRNRTDRDASFGRRAHRVKGPTRWWHSTTTNTSDNAASIRFLCGNRQAAAAPPGGHSDSTAPAPAT